MKRPVPLYDFKAFGQAIKATRTSRGERRMDVSDAMNAAAAANPNAAARSLPMDDSNGDDEDDDD